MEAPETRVLIIITGGTICMQPSENGLVPVCNVDGDELESLSNLACRERAF